MATALQHGGQSSVTHPEDAGKRQQPGDQNVVVVVQFPPSLIQGRPSGNDVIAVGAKPYLPGRRRRSVEPMSSYDVAS